MPVVVLAASMNSGLSAVTVLYNEHCSTKSEGRKVQFKGCENKWVCAKGAGNDTQLSLKLLLPNSIKNVLCNKFIIPKPIEPLNLYLGCNYGALYKIHVNNLGSY